MFRLMQAMCFNSIQLNQLISITHVIQHPFPTAAMCCTHAALQCLLIVVRCSNPQKHNMFCARLAAAVVVELLLAVTGMVRMCCRVECWVASYNCCAAVPPPLVKPSSLPGQTQVVGSSPCTPQRPLCCCSCCCGAWHNEPPGRTGAADCTGD